MAGFQLFSTRLRRLPGARRRPHCRAPTVSQAEMNSEIDSVHGRRVWDSRGYPAVEAEVGLACGAVGRAMAPAGKSTGANEAIDLRDDRGPGIGAHGVQRAVANINGEIARRLRGMDAVDQRGVD